MAYVNYFACDKCGREGGVWINNGCSKSIAIMIARERGWQVGKKGWFCPDCRRKRKNK